MAMNIHGFLCLMAAGMLCAGSAWSHSVEVLDFKGDLALQQLTDRIYVAHGPQRFPDPQTQAFMNNPGFVVTDGGVVVVDPGSSVQIGRKLLDGIARVTDQPVVAVFNTHVHGDHWLGNQALRQAYPAVAIYAHQRMIERIEAGEGDDWVRLFDRLTDGATAGTRVVAPTIGLRGGEEIVIGNIPFRIHHFGKAHSDNDIMVEIPRDRSIFLGDVVTNRRVQSARPGDSDIVGQIRAVEFVLTTDNDWFIPGHGSSGGREVAERQLAFLQKLYASVRRHYEAGLADFEMRDRVKQDLSEYRDWYNFDELGRVIGSVYLRVEEDAF
jgi:glyoxylase-like metal-dependent hydrolase (beta-lactamase superfamily II)